MFKNQEISSELFSALMAVLSTFGIENKENIEQTANMMVSFSKASQFDMTLMFMDSKEKKDLIKIVQEVKKAGIDKEVLKKIEQIYKI